MTTVQLNIESETLVQSLNNNTENTTDKINTNPLVSTEVSISNDANLPESTNEEAEALIVERKYHIKDHILPVLIFILCLIILHNILSIILSIVFLLDNYLLTLCTLLAVFIPILISSYVVYTWESITREANLFKSFLHELTKYKYYKEYKQCVNVITKYKQQHDVEKHKEVIRKIEDLRYFTLINALLYSCIQLFTQGAIIKYFNYVYSLPVQIGLIILSVILIILSIIIIRCAFCDFKNDLGIYRVSIFTYLTTLMSISLYILDIFTDIFIATKYICNEHSIRGTVTFMFIIIPGILGYWLHHCYVQRRTFTVNKTNILTMLLSLEPVFGYWKSVKLLKQTRQAEMTNDKRKQKIDYLKYVGNNVIVAGLRFNECLTESCPQIIIQLSFLFLTVNLSQLTDEKLYIVNIISPVFSVLNVAVSVVLSLRSARIRDFDEDPFPIQGMIIHFLGYIPIASRLISLSLLASQHPYWTFLAMFLHWFLIMLWITCTTKEYNIPQLLNSGIIAIGCTYVPFEDNKTKEIIFQVIFFVENIAVMIFWKLSKFGVVTISGILILIGTVVVPSIIGWICRYFYTTNYDAWIREFLENRSQRLQPL